MPVIINKCIILYMNPASGTIFGTMLITALTDHTKHLFNTNILTHCKESFWQYTIYKNEKLEI